jgi:ketosteroid isomerase-like protein
MRVAPAADAQVFERRIWGATGGKFRGDLARNAGVVRCSFQGDRFMSQGRINALGFFVLGAVLSAIGAAQTGTIDPATRKDIDAGNQAWVTGMKDGRAAPIAATYAENAVDCAPTGECVKGRAAIEDYMRTRIAKLGRAIAASATSLGSVQQGDFVYEWGRSEVSFANGQKVAHRYLTVWQLQPGGVWKIFRNMPIPDDAPR